MRNALATLCVSSSVAATTGSLAAAASSAAALGDALPRQPSSASAFQKPHITHGTSLARIIELRGGGGVESEAPRKKKKGKSSKKAVAADSSDVTNEGQSANDGETDAAKSKSSAKNAINDAMKESDAATALGDAIRDRADILLRDRLPYPERTFDTALVSVGLSLGTAGTDKDALDSPAGDGNNGKVDATLAYYQYGHRNSRGGRGRMNEQHVQPSTSAVIANYFLKTHGGTHIIQCLLSLLASVLGVACLVLPSFPSSAVASVAAGASTSGAATKVVTSQTLSRKIILSTLKYQLMQQTLLLAIAKHFAALLGAVFIGASRIPQLGIRNARRHLELVATDPVGQYLFYCSLLVVWMGWFGGGSGGGMSEYMGKLKGSVVSIMNASAAASTTDDATVTTQLLDTLSQQPAPWFLSQSYGGSLISLIILGPILIREVISVIWVFSDVLTLAFTSSGGTIGKFLSGVLSACRSVLDAFMSILITSEKWRKADSFQRQRSLAKLASNCSLVMELAVGGILIGDAILSFWTFAFVGATPAGGSGRVPFKSVLGKLACAELYFSFLLSRRKKIAATVVGSVRGGGAAMHRVLDVLIDPMKEMGLVDDEDE